jgi:hypothetical protein
MATVFNSDQMAKVLGTPVKLVKPNEFGGRLRTLYFSCTLPASGLATGDTITAGRIPANARLIGGNISWSATQGATATTAVGSIVGATTTAGAYLAAVVTASTAKVALIATQALGHGTVTTAETTVVITNAAAAWTASSVLTGNIDYVVD